MINGHQHILNYLKRSIEKDRISHAYLFEGSGFLEKKEVALWFAKSLGCQNPDITEISVPEGKKEISIEQIRELRRYLSLSPYGNSYKIAIIDGAERMTQEAANALLKTLEEPKGSTVLILIANILSVLPETILSRCEKIKFRAISLDKISKDFIEKEYIDILQKPVNDAFKYIEKISKENSKVIPLLDSWLFWFREQMIKAKSRPEPESPKNFVKIIKEIQKTKNLILSTNINKQLALENLVLEINV